MPNNLGFRSGQVLLQKCRVVSTSVIEPGDLVYLDSIVVRPASEFTWNTDLATTQQGFADVFMGIAHEQSANDEDAPVSVDVSAGSVYEFSVASSSYDNGNMLGPDEGSSNLLNQQLEYVGAASQAIARSTEFVDVLVTRLRVSFASAFTVSSANSNAAIG